MSYNGDLYAQAEEVITSKGDLRRGDASGNPERYGIGSTNQILSVSSGNILWKTLTTADSVLTTQGDVLFEGASGLERLGQSTDGFVLTTKGAAADPVWAAAAGVSLSDNNTWTGTNIFNGFISSTPTELTLSSGVVTATRMCHLIDTEGDASTDTMTHMNGYDEGRIVILTTINGARDVTLDDEAGGAGTLNMDGDFTLSQVSDTITFCGRLTDGLTFMELSRSNNTA